MRRIGSLLSGPNRQTVSSDPFGSHGFEKARHLLVAAQRVFTVTGAGMSQDSGIPPFRGAGGIFGASDEITAPVFVEDLDTRPDEVFSFVQQLRDQSASAAPHRGHLALARAQKRLRDRGGDMTLITMNIDNLHERAGADALHLHGSGRFDRCREECRVHLPATAVPGSCPECGSPTRPDVVLYGEPMDLDVEWAGKHALRAADVFLAIGTSGATNKVSRWVVEASRDYRIPTILFSLDADPAFASLFDVVVNAPAKSLDSVLA